jgi:hypothetical protein
VIMIIIPVILLIMYVIMSRTPSALTIPPTQ